MADIDSKILRQVDFYFSDSNFPKDKFLRAQAAQNEQGFVPISTLTTFNRMKELSTDIPHIAKVLKDSTTVEVNEDGTMIKRKNPLPEADASIERTIYAKGFPTDGISIDDISKVFAPFGKVLSVRVRKTLDKKSKESAFIEFEKAEEAKAAVSASPIPKYNEKDLKILMKQDYVQSKKEEKKKAEAEKKDSKRKVDDENGGSEQKNKRQRRGKGEKDEKHEDKNEEKKDEPVTPGLIVQFKNIGTGVTREILKEVFGKYGKVAFADFSQNEASGYIRFGEAAEAKNAVESMKNEKVSLGGQVPELSILEGEEEKSYWDKVKEKRDATKNKKGKGGGSKRGKKRRRF